MEESIGFEFVASGLVQHFPSLHFQLHSSTSFHRNRMRDNGSLNKSQPSANAQTSGFFRMIHPSIVREKKMAISTRFVHEFGKELFQIATITLDDGFVWKIGLERRENKILFSHGWKQFMEYYSIECGQFLFFKYEGKSQFHVHICDKTTFFLDFPSQVHRRKHETDEPRNCSSSPQREHLKKEDVTDISDPLAKTGHKSKSKGSSNRAFEAARKFKSANPNCLVAMKSYSISTKTTTSPYFPASFANHLRTCTAVKLQTSGSDRQWKVFLRRNGMHLSKGWALFSRDNNLEDGNFCIFELLHRTEPVLKVHIFRHA